MDYLPPGVKEMRLNDDGTFTVTFTEKPTFIYVASGSRQPNKPPIRENIYFNGWLPGWRNVRIESEVEGLPVIEMEFFPFKD